MVGCEKASVMPSKCPECEQMCHNFEEWGPYKAVWSRLGGKPWTWVMRDNPYKYFILMIPLAVFLFFHTGKKYWAAIAAFGLGMLTGHVWW